MNNNIRGQQSPLAILIFSISLIATSTTLISTAEIFSDVTVISGIDFKHTDGESRQRLFNEFLGAGGGFFDYDNDGDLDIYLVNGTPQTSSESDQLPHNRLYRNDGDDSFTDVTQMAGVGDTGYGIGCTVGDYDNDGDLDLYLTNFGSNVLYQNSGNGTFIDVSEEAGVADPRFGSSCAFADVDNDGLVDLYVANYAEYSLESDKRCEVRGIWVYCGPHAYPSAEDALYHNNGDGTFSNMSIQMGLLDVPACHGLGVTFGDYDNDGDQDLYVANDQDPNFLFQNLGNGKFEEVALLSGVCYNDMGKEEAGMGTAFGDYDNDGLLDLTVSNFQAETNTIYHNTGDGFFTDVTITTGVAEITNSYLGWGIQYFDYDNDGYKDIFVANGHVMDNINQLERNVTYPQRNLLLKNMQDGTFKNITDQSGLSLINVSRGAAFGDYDNDGDFDILVTNWNQPANLLRNETGNLNNWVQIKAIGQKSNRSGIGTRIKIVTGDLIQYQEIQSGGSYLSFSSLQVHFGLAKAKEIDLIEIHWPSGQIDRSSNLNVNQKLIAIEGAEIKSHR